MEAAGGTELPWDPAQVSPGTGDLCQVGWRTGRIPEAAAQVSPGTGDPKQVRGLQALGQVNPLSRAAPTN